MKFTSRQALAAYHLLRDIRHFSAAVLRMRLHGYQVRPLLSVIDSILHQRGYEFLLVMPRQSGKNEAVAHLLVYLLNLFQRRGGNIVFAALADQVGRGILRLEDRLDNDWNRNAWGKGTEPIRRTLGKAAVVFLSSFKTAKSRGETAHWLLVVDELQDQDAGHLEAVFTPMRVANNATALYIGTVRLTSDALWQKKIELEAEQARDGVQRVFFVQPDEVIQYNAAYGAFLDGQIARHGRQHPIIQSEYYLKPIDGEGGMFPPRRVALMRGEHARQREPQPGQMLVALLDVAGQDEGATDPIAALSNPGRDYTICTIAEVVSIGYLEYQYRCVDVFVDHGSKHFEDHPGRPSLAKRLLAYLEHWRVLHVVCDGTGVGEGLANWLAARLGTRNVTAVKLNASAKAKLGSDLISLVELGRFRYWCGDEDEILSDGWWFWQQVGFCGYEMPVGGDFERHLRWGVPETARVNPLGESKSLKVHDDRLLSAALVAILNELLLAGELVLSAAESRVVPGYDPLDDLGSF